MRFVALQSPVSRLEIAEVRVLDEQGANIALTATASTGAARAPDATSGCSNGAASYAIDGNTCTYASSLYGDLLVDIGSQRVVTNVVVIGRNAGYWGDNFSFRNNGASVSFLDASRAVLGSALLNSPCTYNPYIDSPGHYAGATCTTTTFSLLSMPLDTSPSSTVMSSPSGMSSPAVFVSASASVAASATASATASARPAVGRLWSQNGGNARNTRLSPNLGPQSASVRWSVSTNGVLPGVPTLGPSGTLYLSVASSSDDFYAIDSATGALQWNTSGLGLVWASIAVGPDESLYFGTGNGRILAWNGTARAQRWAFSTGTGKPLWSSPVLGQDGSVYVGSEDNHLYALNANGTLRWRLDTRDYVYPPSLSEDGSLVYVQSRNGSVYACYTTSGATRWVFATGGGVEGSPAVGDDGTVYFGSRDHSVYAVNGTTGAQRWRFVTRAAIVSSPALGPGGTVFVASSDSMLYARNGRSGAPVWSVSTGTEVFASPAVDAAGTLFVATQGGAVMALNGTTGAQLWVASVGGAVKAGLSIGPDGTLFVASYDQRLYAFNSPLAATPTISPTSTMSPSATPSQTRSTTPFPAASPSSSGTGSSNVTGTGSQTGTTSPSCTLTSTPSVTEARSDSCTAQIVMPVYSLPADAGVGLSGYVVSGPEAYVGDRCGNAGGALYASGNLRVTSPAGAGARLPSGNAPRTLAAWVQCAPGANPAGEYKEFLGMGTPPRANTRFSLGVFGSGLTHVAEGNDWLANMPVCTNYWTHVAATFDGASLTLYVNGTSLGSVTRTFATVATGTVCHAWNGANSHNGGEAWTGAMDDVAIYDVSLSSAQVRGLAGASCSTQTAALGVYVDARHAGRATLAAGWFHTCVVTTGGMVACWGDNRSGQTAVPAAIAAGGQVAVSAGAFHTCALSAGGGVVCWGDNGSGQTAVPAVIVAGGQLAVTAGGGHTCALSTAGGVACWGRNQVGQLGVPSAVAAGGQVSVTAGDQHTCALSAGGGVACWGWNLDGQVSVPTAVASGGRVAVTAGAWHNCALSTAGGVACWGAWDGGRTAVPAAVAASGQLVVAAGAYHSCALSAGDWMACWGSNSDGQTAVPSTVAGGQVAVAAGYAHTCAQSAGGGVACWGSNSSGQSNVPSAIVAGAVALPCRLTALAIPVSPNGPGSSFIAGMAVGSCVFAAVAALVLFAIRGKARRVTLVKTSDPNSATDATNAAAVIIAGGPAEQPAVNPMFRKSIRSSTAVLATRAPSAKLEVAVAVVPDTPGYSSEVAAVEPIEVAAVEPVDVAIDDIGAIVVDSVVPVSTEAAISQVDTSATGFATSASAATTSATCSAHSDETQIKECTEEPSGAKAATESMLADVHAPTIASCSSSSSPASPSSHPSNPASIARRKERAMAVQELIDKKVRERNDMQPTAVLSDNAPSIQLLGGRNMPCPVDFNEAIAAGFTKELWWRATHDEKTGKRVYWSKSVGKPQGRRCDCFKCDA